MKISIQKPNKRSMIFAILVFFVVLVLFGSTCFSTKKAITYRHTDDIRTIVTHEELEQFHKTHDTTNTENTYIVDLTGVQEKTRFIAIKLKEGSWNPSVLEIFGYADETEYEVIRAFSVLTYSDSGYIVITLDDLEYAAIGVSRISGENIVQVEFHENEPEFSAFRLPFKTGYFIISILIAAFAGLFACRMEEKYTFLPRIRKWMKEQKKLIKRGLLTLLVTGGVSGVIMIALWVLKIDAHPHVNRFFSVAGILTAALWLYASRKQLQDKVENVFLGFILIVGVTMIVGLPFGHNGWDIDTHYRLSVEAANMKDGGFTHADLLFTNSRGDTRVDDTYYGNLGRMFNLNKCDGPIVELFTSPNISLAHLPAGLMIAVGRNLHLPFLLYYYMGEFANLLLYSLLGFFAIRRLKSGKLLLAAVLLIPTNIFMAGCYNYDYWVLGFTMLGMSYFVGECQRPDEKVSMKNTLIMFGAFTLGCVPKQIYAPLILIPFLIRPKKLEKKWKYYLTGAAMFLIMLLMLMLRSGAEVESAGDTRIMGGSVEPGEQLSFIMGHLVWYMKLLKDFLIRYCSIGNILGALTNYGQLSPAEGLAGASIIFILITALAVLDKDECDRNVGVVPRIYTVLLFFGGAAVIATAFYLVCTPVGERQIIGTQARYLTPLFYPMLSVAASGRLMASKRIHNKVAAGEIVFGVILAVIAMNVAMITYTHLK